MSERLPINDENMRRLGEQAAKAAEDARRAIKANGPKIAACLESFRSAIQDSKSSADTRTSRDSRLMT